MQGHDYIFAIQSKDYRFWKYAPNGITLSADPYFLVFSPDGWQDTSVTNVKNKKYWSVDRTVSIPYKYLKDGAQILKHIYYNLGDDEHTYLTILKQELALNPVPVGGITVTTGGNPLTVGSNTGIITGDAGTIVYIRFEVTDGFYVDNISGTIGTESVFINGAGGPVIFPVTIPPSGSIAYNLTFTDVSGGSNNTMQASNANGSTVPGYAYWYKQIYRGEIDYNSLKHRSFTVTASTAEDGLAKLLKANDKVVYEIPINVPEAIEVAADGVKLHETLLYQDLDNMPISYANSGQQFLGPVVFLRNEGNSSGVLYDTEVLKNNTGGTYSEQQNDLNVILTNYTGLPLDIRLIGRIEFKCTGMDAVTPMAVRFRYMTSALDISNQNAYQIISTPSMTVGQTYGADYDITITLAPGETLLRQGIFFAGSGTDAVIEHTDNSNFKIKFISRFGVTYIKAFQPQYLFNQLINLVTEGQYQADQNIAYFQQHKQMTLTCGNAIRGLVDAKMKISLATFFEIFDCQDSVALTEINGVVGFSTKAAQIDATDIVDLPEPALDTFEVSTATDMRFNVIEYGYPEIRNEVGALNGNEEYNCKFIRSIDDTSAAATMVKICPAKASCFEIESIRIATLSKDTTDYKNDNDLYLLYTEADPQPAGYYNLDRSLNTSATGVTEKDTVFNIPLSPMRMLMRQASWIHSHFYKQDGKVIKFRSADKNSAFAAGGIDEDADIIVGDLPAAFAIPRMFDMELPPPYAIDNVLEVRPNTLYRFPVKGIYYIGILQKISNASARRKVQQIQLLSVAENDLTTLINYQG